MLKMIDGNSWVSRIRLGHLIYNNYNLELIDFLSFHLTAIAFVMWIYPVSPFNWRMYALCLFHLLSQRRMWFLQIITCNGWLCHMTCFWKQGRFYTIRYWKLLALKCLVKLFRLLRWYTHVYLLRRLDIYHITWPIFLNWQLLLTCGHHYKWYHVAFFSPFLSKDLNRYKAFSGHVTKVWYNNFLKITKDTDNKLFVKFDHRRGFSYTLVLNTL